MIFGNYVNIQKLKTINFYFNNHSKCFEYPILEFKISFLDDFKILSHRDSIILKNEFKNTVKSFETEAILDTWRIS